MRCDDACVWLAHVENNVHMCMVQVGMHHLDIVFANQRLAPVQVASYGHSSSTHGSLVDWWLAGREAEPSPIPASSYSERVLLLPGDPHACAASPSSLVTHSHTPLCLLTLTSLALSRRLYGSPDLALPHASPSSLSRQISPLCPYLAHALCRRHLVHHLPGMGVIFSNYGDTAMSQPAPAPEGITVVSLPWTMVKLDYNHLLLVAEFVRASQRCDG